MDVVKHLQSIAFTAINALTKWEVKTKARARTDVVTALKDDPAAMAALLSSSSTSPHPPTRNNGLRAALDASEHGSLRLAYEHLQGNLIAMVANTPPSFAQAVAGSAVPMGVTPQPDNSWSSTASDPNSSFAVLPHLKSVSKGGQLGGKGRPTKGKEKGFENSSGRGTR